MPITPFIGVRISWLMFARNSDFAARPPSRPRAMLDRLDVAEAQERRPQRLGDGLDGADLERREALAAAPVDGQRPVRLPGRADRHPQRGDLAVVAEHPETAGRADVDEDRLVDEAGEHTLGLDR